MVDLVVIGRISRATSKKGQLFLGKKCTPLRQNPGYAYVQSHIRCISRVYRSSSYMIVIRLRSRSQEQKGPESLFPAM